MFNLNETITAYNQNYNAKIKSNKTWGLIYLQPKPLALLNQCFQLIDGSVYYASPFATDRKALRAALANTKKQSSSEALPTLRNIVQQLKTDHFILQRLHWEENLCAMLNNKTFWETHLNQADSHPLIQGYLTHLQAQWNTHQPFQYHSSQGLLFLLDVVMDYHYHFTQAHKELQTKQAAWIPFFRIPDAIAEKYRQFLGHQLNQLKLLQNQVLNALLLRLRIAEQQNQVTCGDVSYFLAQESQRLNLSPIASLSLPQRQPVLDTTTFNNIHRAIEKYGHANHKKQLYQLAWHEYAEFNSEDITVITLSQHRLLAPKALLNFLPKNYSQFMGLFTNNTKRLEFLEAQQALLAQLALSLNFAKLPQESVSIAFPALRSLTTRHQLLQQSLQLLDRQSIRYWQWQQKSWKKAWHKWILGQLQKNQASLSDCLADFYQQVQNREDLLNQVSLCEKVRCIIQPIQALIDNDPTEHRNTLLSTTLKRLSALIQEKKPCSATDPLLQSFRQDLLTALKGYIQHYHNQGQTLPKERHVDFDYLWNLLLSSHDIGQLREEVNQRYRTMQPTLFKLIPALDSSFLRRSLKAVLENPKYSMAQLNRAALSQSEKNKCLESKALPVASSITDNRFVSDTNNSQLTTAEEIDQLQKRIQRLINNTEGSYPFFKELPKNDVDNNSNFLKRVHSMA